MVGIVVVSHSDVLAEGVVRLAREMAGEELALEAAGGFEEAGVLGTDADRVKGAIERAMSPDGVLVLMDLGSALMSAEFAVEMLEGATGPVKLSAAPLVEGTVAAAVAGEVKVTRGAVGSWSCTGVPPVWVMVAVEPVFTAPTGTCSVWLALL